MKKNCFVKEKGKKLLAKKIMKELMEGANLDLCQVFGHKSFQN